MREVYPKKMFYMLEIKGRRRTKNLELRVENWYPTTCCEVKNWYRLKNIYLWRGENQSNLTNPSLVRILLTCFSEEHCLFVPQTPSY